MLVNKYSFEKKCNIVRIIIKMSFSRKARLGKIRKSDHERHNLSRSK